MGNHQDLTGFLRPPAKPSTPYSIVILNQPLNERTYDVISDNATLIICADGGANRLYDHHQHHHHHSPTLSCSTCSRLPSAIVGDLDSITPTVLSHYRSLSVPIIRDNDQYATDFTKALKYIRSYAAAAAASSSVAKAPSLKTPNSTSDGRDRITSGIMDVLAFGTLGGRIDQAFSLIHHLFAAPLNPTWLSGSIYLISEENLSLVVERGITTLMCGPRDDADRVFDENVGIIPLLGRSRITTKGLEWDVKDWDTEFGGQVSTSNHLRSEVVEVETSDRVLFTVEFAEGFRARGVKKVGDAGGGGVD